MLTAARRLFVATALVSASGFLLACRGPLVMDALAEAPPSERHEVLSQVYFVDKKYRSMMGPTSQQPVVLAAIDPPELLWITGYRAVVVGEDGETEMPQQFMCHSNLDLDPALHFEKLGGDVMLSGRLFTLSQGQQEVVFPPGFGIPVFSNEPLALTTQVLNLNHDEIAVHLRHRVEIDFVHDRDLERGLVPLLPLAAYGLASLETKPETFGDAAAAHGASCLVRPSASEHAYTDDEGRKFTGHWVVDPGREVNTTRVTEILALPFDTRLHYVAVHLHPFAESLELIDKTAGRTIFKSQARQLAGGIGLEHVEAFSSVEGVSLERDHEYEMVSVYDNTSGEPQDSMAVMYMYVRDEAFRRPRGPRGGKESR